MLITHFRQLQRHRIFLFMYLQMWGFSNVVLPLLVRLGAWLLAVVILLPHSTNRADLPLQVIILELYLLKVLAGLVAILLVSRQDSILDLKVFDSLCYSAKLLPHSFISDRALLVNLHLSDVVRLS